MAKRLHIICHDVPFPPDYGGVFDLFYKIKALHAQGILIKLHCFLYRKEKQPQLASWCEEVHYYERQVGLSGLSLSVPYIVKSRAIPALYNNLVKDNDPVLMEGIHCTAFAGQLLQQGRKIALRLHNVEHLYYRSLASIETNPFRRAYYLAESRLLRKYENSLPAKIQVITVSSQDATYYRDVFKKTNLANVPVFVPFHEVSVGQRSGGFCLYHGNLSVRENEKAAIWLHEEVFSKINVPLVVAGKQPSPRLFKKLQGHGNTKLVANPTDQQLEMLIGEAQINVLPSYNNTGVKLKLIHALFHGRHCLVNEQAVNGSGLEHLCHIGNDAGSMVSQIAQLREKPFGREQIEQRSMVLQDLFNNKKNAEELIQLIW